MNDRALADALNAVGQSDKFSMFKQVMDGVYGSFRDFDPISQQHLKDRFIEGVYSGAVYERNTDYKSNEGYLNPLQVVQRQSMIDENKRANAKWDYEKKQYQIASGEPFVAGDGKTYRYNQVNNTYVPVDNPSQAVPAPTNPQPGRKGRKQGEAKQAKVVGVDSDGQKINVSGEAQGAVMKTGTQQLRKEWNEAWNMIKEAHPDIQPGEYRLRKYIKKATSEDGEDKVYYYAEPVSGSNAASDVTTPAASVPVQGNRATTAV